MTVYHSKLKQLLADKNEYMRKSDPRFVDYRVEYLANYIGVSRQALQAWMSDSGVKRLPVAEHQCRLEAFFGVPWQAMWYINGFKR